MSEIYYMKKGAITDRFLRAIYFGVALQVITSVIFVSVLYDILLKSSGLDTNLIVYVILSGLLFVALCYCFNKYLRIPIIRRFGIIGGLTFTPIMLFAFSIPATVYFLVGGLDISVAELPLLVFVTLSFIVFIAAMVIFAIPSDHIIVVGFDKGQKKILKRGVLFTFVAIIAVITGIILEALNLGFKIPLSHFYLALPAISVLMVLNSVEQLHRLRKDIISKIASYSPEDSATSS